MIDPHPADGAPENSGRSFLDLVARYLDGDLAATQRKQLDALLAEDAHNRDLFGEICTQAYLLSSLLEPDLDADATLLAEESEGPPAGTTAGRGLPPTFAMGFPSLFSSLTFRAVSYCVLAALLACGGAVAGWLWSTSRPHGVAVRKHQRQPAGENPGSRRQTHPVQLPMPSPADRNADLAGGSTPRQQTAGSPSPQPGLMDAAGLVGNGVIAESGSGQLVYRTGTRVSLRGPYKFGVPSADSGALFYGKSTVYVTSGSPFSLRMPNTLLTCSGGEFGVEIDHSGEGWIQVFRGGATLWVPNSAMLEATGKIALRENESVRIRQRDGRCMATVVHDAGLAASLASRMPPRLSPQDGGNQPSPAALAWKPSATALPGSAALPAASETDARSMFVLTSAGNSPPDAPGATNYTRSVRFSLSELLPHIKRADLVPGRCVLEVRFIARRFVVYAIRLNGKEILLPEEPLDGSVEQIGAVMIREGFFGGDGADVLEFDVRNTEPGQVLPQVLDRADGPVVARLRVFVSKASLAAPPNPPSAKDNATEKR
jgi:hypothetical protein